MIGFTAGKNSENIGKKRREELLTRTIPHSICLRSTGKIKQAATKVKTGSEESLH
jgi:hypothetical protein